MIQGKKYKEVQTRKTTKTKCPMCTRKQGLLFESRYDENSCILSTLDVCFIDGGMEVSSHATYIADVVEKDGMQEKNFTSGIERIIPISYCPICGRKLK